MKYVPTSAKEFKQLMTLFNQTNQMGYRHTYVWSVSKHRTESTRELTMPEVKQLIRELQGLLPKEKKKFAPPPGDKQRKKMLSIASKMYPTENTKQLLDRIDKWCRVQKFKKPLMKHNEDELNLLLTIYNEKVLVDFYTNLHK